MPVKKLSRGNRSRKAYSRINYSLYTLLGIFGVFIVVIAIVLSTTLSKAAKYTPYPTPASIGQTPYPTPSTDETIIKFTYPKDNDTVIHNSWVNSNAFALDWDGISKMEIYIDGKFYCQGNSSSLGCLWRAGKPGTIHLLEVRSWDGKGNTASASIHVTSK